VSKLLDMELFPAAPAEGLVQHLPYVKLLHTRSVPHHHHKTAAAAGPAAAAANSPAPPPHPSDSKSSGRHDDDEELIDDVLTEAHFEIFTAKPCWGTLKISGADIVSWSIFSDGVYNDAASFMAGEQRGSGSTIVTRKKGAEGIAVDSDEDWGDGVMRSLIVKWTSEQQQGALHWPMRVRFYSKEQQQGLKPEQNHGSSSDGGAGSSSGGKTGLSVELHVGYVGRTAELAAVQARMPAWSTLSYEATTYISSWEF
jgi:hypothetical protein